MNLNYKMQLFGFWSGILYVFLLGLGFQLIAGYLPPHEPASGAAEISSIYHSDALRIRTGMIICMFSAVFFMPFSIAVALELEQIEGRFGMLAIWQVLGGVGTAILTFYPAMWWLIASYRLNRSPELIQLLNDIGWLQFVGGLSLFMPCVVTVVLGSFLDERDIPTFPRWSGYLSLWLAIFVLPGQLIFFYHAGPFAWDGLFGFWLPVIALVLWLIMIAVLIRKSALRIKELA